MKISGFTFLRNAESFGYPFVQSIRSLLPLVDEYVIALGPCADATEERIRAIGDPKIRILPTTWNERMRNDRRVKGFIYGQQKSIALFNCTGDWAFYLEGDEVLHEKDLPSIRAAMERHVDDPRVEALYFDYLHFYGNARTIAWSPAWYRRAPRVLRNNIPAWAPKGLFFTVLDDAKRGRYPYAAHGGGTIYHYGWVRGQERMQATREQNHRFWSSDPTRIDLGAIDPRVLREFTGTHPALMRDWLQPADEVFQPDPNHRLTRRERKHRWMMAAERLLGVDLTKKHYRDLGA